MRTLLLLLLVSPLLSEGQKKEPVTPATANSTIDLATHYETAYKLALQYGDYGNATGAVLNILALDESNMGWKDTLATLMFARGAYDQCYQIGLEVFSAQPENLKILELLAVSAQSLGLMKESLLHYEMLYPKTRSLFHLYQMASLQFGLQRIGECQASLDAIIANPDSEKEKISITVSQNQSQEVILKAAAYNVKGVIARQLNDLPGAKAAYEEALKVMPDFVLPAGNLDEIKKSEAGK